MTSTALNPDEQVVRQLFGLLGRKSGEVALRCTTILTPAYLPAPPIRPDRLGNIGPLGRDLGELIGAVDMLIEMQFLSAADLGAGRWPRPAPVSPPVEAAGPAAGAAATTDAGAASHGRFDKVGRLTVEQYEQELNLLHVAATRARYALFMNDAVREMLETSPLPLSFYKGLAAA